MSDCPASPHGRHVWVEVLPDEYECLWCMAIGTRQVDPAELPEDTTLLIVNALAIPGFPPPVEGAERRPCGGCGRDTWAAPSSIAAEQVRRTVHACRRCGSGVAFLAGIQEGVRLRDGATSHPA